MLMSKEYCFWNVLCLRGFNGEKGALIVLNHQARTQKSKIEGCPSKSFPFLRKPTSGSITHTSWYITALRRWGEKQQQLKNNSLWQGCAELRSCGARRAAGRGRWRALEPRARPPAGKGSFFLFEVLSFLCKQVTFKCLGYKLRPCRLASERM